MAVSVARAEAAAPALPRLRVASLPALALIVAVSAAARTAVAWLKATPVYLPDEYMYSELGRSLAESGRPLVRGVGAAFPSLLQPVLTAPFWLVDDVEVAYRLVQALGALAMSLAAPAAYVLARRAGLARTLSLGVAAVAVAVPDMIFAGWVLAEPFAYPIVLGAVAAAVSALERPTRRKQLVFVGFAALAVLARTQLAVLPIVYAMMVVLMGMRGGGVRAALRSHSLALGLFLSPIILALAVGRERVLGIYSSPYGGQAREVLGQSNWAGPDVLVILYIVGFALVPGALLGLALGILRPRSRAELAFSGFAVTLTLALLAQAALFGALHVVQERYVFYVVPLLAVAFGLFASRGWPHRRAHALVAAALLVVAARWPLAGFAAAEGREHSPTLIALGQLEARLGEAGIASLVVAGVAGILCAAAALAPRRPAAGTALGLGTAIAVGTIAWGAVAYWDVSNANRISTTQLGPDRSWVAHSGLDDVVLLRSFDAQRLDAIQLFWNRNVDRVGLFQGAERLDAFTNERVVVQPDGALRLGGRPLRAPLLVEEHAVTVRLSGAEVAGRSPVHTLWKPTGTPRLSLYLLGRFWDGWLGGGGGLNLWPEPGDDRLAGYFELDVRAPASIDGATLTFTPAREPERTTTVHADRWTTVRLAVCSDGPWQAEFQASERGFVGGKVVSFRSREPVFRPDPGACAGKPV